MSQTTPAEAAILPFYDPIKQVMDTLEAIIRRKLVQTPTGYMEFVTLCNVDRVYLCTTDVLADDMWGEIRKSPMLVDFVIEIARELYIRCSCIAEANGNVYDWLADLVAASMTGFVGTSSSMDTDFLRQFNHEGIGAVLKANPWLTILNLAGMLSVIQSPVQVKELEPPKEEGAK